MEILHLYLSAKHNFIGHHGQAPGEEPMMEKTELECVAGRGIRGDRFFDHKPDFKGQITFFESENHEWLCECLKLSEARPSDYRRNVITKGADLNALIGKEFEVQGVRFIGTEEAKPCYWMDQALAAGAHEALKGRGGLRARILTDGCLRLECEPTAADT
jgi:MOSC domain-containing protein YiiM